MKAFIFYTTSGDRWELCGSSYLVTAETREEAEAIFYPQGEEITEITEIDLTVTGQIEIQGSIVE